MEAQGASQGRHQQHLQGEENPRQKQQPSAAPCPDCGTNVPQRKPQAGEKYVGYCSQCKTRLRNTKKCASCPNPFIVKGEGRVDYCQDCLNTLRYGPNDLIAIYWLGNSGGIEQKIFGVGEEAEAERFLSDLGHVSYRIDLHDCLDLFGRSEVLFDAPSTVISYVGRLSIKRRHAEEDIEGRMQTGQVRNGCLVFQRGQGGNANSFHEPGSKAWVNQCLPFTGNAIFVDDAADHHLSVASLKIPGLRSVHVTSKDAILSALEKFKLDQK